MRFNRIPLRAALVGLVALLLTAGFAPPLQPAAPRVTLSASAGYDGLFRENEWLPLLVRVANEGDPVRGQLIVRPETSGGGLPNTFSTPVDLPTGARQAVMLYITARSFASEVRVELIDDDGLVLAAQAAPLRGILLQDQLYVVASTSSVGTPDLSTVRAGGFNSFQANWTAENFPDRASALDAVNTILFTDINTAVLSLGQRAALADWVIAGGHLIVAGGIGWQPTAAGLTDLLPLVPDASITAPDLGALARFAAADPTALAAETIIATGALTPDAEVLAATDAGQPLIARRAVGSGLVDYLAVDPVAAPLRGWAGMGDLWFTLIATRGPVPAWAYGVVNPGRAAEAAQILPGYNLLPDVLPLCGFLALYIALIGPLNYALLNRINRREWAWLTIPVFIILFSGLSWVVGFSLRGNTATMSRITLVQSWPDTERARYDALVGLLSPRRADYQLTMGDDGFLRPISGGVQNNPFLGSIQASTDIRQADQFSAGNFSVDASFIATFSASGTTDRPEIDGQAALIYAPDGLTVRGAVQNNTGLTLTDPVILMRDGAIRLDTPLTPGALIPFDGLIEPLQRAPAPSPLERTLGDISITRTFQRFARSQLTDELTVREILGEDTYNNRAYFTPMGSAVDAQEQRRRQLFLSALMVDQFNVSGRGDRVFVAAWADSSPIDVGLAGSGWEALDLTLYLAELPVEVTRPAGLTTVGVDEFTWVALERAGVTSEVAPVNLVLQPAETAAFRFTPGPGARLDEVTRLTVRADSFTNLRVSLPVELWNWETEAWDLLELQSTESAPLANTITINRPAAYIGPQNAVHVRLSAGETLTTLRLAQIAVEQTGRFTS